MTQAVAPAQTGQSLITTMANRYGLEPGKFYATLEKTILPSNKNASQEQVAAFLVVANHYQLNPFIKEIFAFPSQSGGIQPIVSVDGWLTIINRQPTLDGIEYQDHFDGDGKLSAITCRIYRKDRSRPNEVTEYMAECRRSTPTWGQWPARMLRHKALIQCARQAFGLAGIYDPDEAERIAEAEGSTNGHSIAEKTKAKVEEMKQRYSPDAPADDADVIDAEIVDEPPVIDDTPPADTDSAADETVAEAEAVDETDDLEKLRANVRTAMDELSAKDRKELLVGKPGVGQMDAEQLQGLLKDIEEATK